MNPSLDALHFLCTHTGLLMLKDKPYGFGPLTNWIRHFSSLGFVGVWEARKRKVPPWVSITAL